MKNDFNKYLLVSLLVHMMVMVFVLFSPSWFEKEDIKPYKVTWLTLSKGDGGINPKSNFKKSETLPQSTVREQKQALEKIAKDYEGMDLKSQKALTKKLYQQKLSQKKTSDKGGINLDKKKNKVTKQDKTKMDDALARIDQQLQQREVDMSAAQTLEGETGQSPYGSDKGSTIDPALIMYFNTIKRKINNQWVVAKKDFSGTLRTSILVKIDARGNILVTSFKGESGNGSFDASALRAIKRSAPFPVPPESIKLEALNEGFLIEFNPKTVTGHI